MAIKLSIRNLNLSFGAKQVLKNINLDIPEKQIIALVGPSGCGKSTLLRSMNRMHDLVPSAKVRGEVYLDGKNIYAPKTDVVEVRRQIGMVFQRPNPFPKSIYKNISYGLELKGIKKKKHIQKIVEQSLKGSYLWEEVKEQLDESALDLSGGQQQRLCIARAIAVEPDVILMDEPCSALDPISTARIEELMLQLKERFTIVIVTHNMQQAQRVADRTAVMYLGEMLEFRPTQELFAYPEHELVAKYLGGQFG